MKIKREHLKNIVRETMIEESEYQEFFKKALEKAGKSIPSMSDEEKKEFFNKIEKTWKGRGEKKNEGNAFGAAVAKAKKDGDDSFEVDGKEYKVESVNEGKFRKEERMLKTLASVVKIDFSEALEVLEEDGVLEAMDHLEHAIERIKDVHKILKRKS